MTRSRTLVALLASLALVAGGTAGCGNASAPSGAIPTGPEPSPAAVAARITSVGLDTTLDALARIATENGGTRRTGGAGDAATAAFLRERLQALGLAVEVDPVDTPVFTDGSGDSLAVLGPGGRSFEARRDFGPFMFAPAGVAEGPVVNLGWDPSATAPSGRGCTSADVPASVRGAIMLVAPGPCVRRNVVLNAQAAGAIAVVSAIPWAQAGRVVRSTLMDPSGMAIPAVAADRDVGLALAAAAASGTRVRVATTGRTETTTLRSVVGELRGRDPTRVVVVGAHLDSSMDGPGIDDDGSGIAAVLALAEGLAGSTPATTVRFAFWAGEESALAGSTAYVQAHARRSDERIVAYINVDMIASPNGYPMVYTDPSETNEPNTKLGFGMIHDLFAADLDAAKVPWTRVERSGGSDDAPFAHAGVPTGGLYTGANEIVTTQAAARYGRTADRPADPCYHLACDGRSNVDEALLLALARSIARVTATIATQGD